MVFYLSEMDDNVLWINDGSIVIINTSINYMKSESLLSQRSNLSQLSNVSYRGEKK